MKKTMLSITIMLMVFVNAFALSAKDNSTDLIKMGLGIFSAAHDRIWYEKDNNGFPTKEVEQSKTGPVAWLKSIAGSNTTFLIKGKTISFKKEQITYKTTLNTPEDTVIIEIFVLGNNLNTITLAANQSRDKVTFSYAKGIDANNELLSTISDELSLSLSENSGQIISRCGKTIGSWFSGGWNGSVTKAGEAWNENNNTSSYSYYTPFDTTTPNYITPLKQDTITTNTSTKDTLPAPTPKIIEKDEFYQVAVNGISPQSETEGVSYESGLVRVTDEITLPDSILTQIKVVFEKNDKISVRFIIYDKNGNKLRETNSLVLERTNDKLSVKNGCLEISGASKFIGGFEKIGFTIKDKKKGNIKWHKCIGKECPFCKDKKDNAHAQK